MDEIERSMSLMELLNLAINLVKSIDRQAERIGQRMDNQSHTIRELARYLSENGVSISRFTTTTQETLVAVALNGDY